jgi:ribosomal protein S18 acetylase RimI-like enzyme
VQLRTARPEDHAAIVGVVDDWWGRPMSALLPRLFLDHFWPTSRVAEDDAGLAGFVVAFRSPAQPHVTYVHFAGVRPDLRGSGLGRRLYADVATRARADGCTELHAVTSPGNTASIRFHQRIGFVVAESPDHDGAGRPMVTFRRLL